MDKSAWAVAALPPGTSTRALRMTFTKGGAGAADDLLADVEEKKGAPSLDATESIAKKGKGILGAGAEDDLWMRRVEGMKLLNRRFENLFSTATVRVNSGKVASDGTWDAQRTEPLSVAEPAIYALEWKQAQSLRGLPDFALRGAEPNLHSLRCRRRAATPFDRLEQRGSRQLGRRLRRGHERELRVPDGRSARRRRRACGRRERARHERRARAEEEAEEAQATREH
jgi:hypothetical protein